MKINPWCLLFSCLFIPASFGHSREKRFLIVPPTAPTRHQWIAGIGVPLDLENIAVTTGYVLKAQYFLPTKVDHLFPLDTWEDIERPKVKRDVAEEVILMDNSTGTNYTQYNVPAVIIEEGLNEKKENGRGFAQSADDQEFERWGSDSDGEVEGDSKAAQSYWNELNDPESGGGENSRWDAYKMLEGLSSSNGVGGKDCVLRSICESAASPISHKSGILGELVHILLTPSSSADKKATEEHNDYEAAEKLGKEDPDACEERYSNCKKSLLEVFTSFENPFENLFNTYL